MDVVKQAIARWGHWLREANTRRRRRGWVSPIRLQSANARLFVLLIVSLAGLSAGLVASFSFLAPVSGGTQVSLDQLQALSANADIRTAMLYDFDHRITGTYTVPAAPAATHQQPRVAQYWATYPSSDSETPALIQMLTGGGATVTVLHQMNKAVVQFVAQYVLPLVILANLFALIFVVTRSGGDSIGGLVQFGRIGRKRRGPENRLTFADVAGADEVVAEMREVRDYLADPARFATLGAQPPKGILLFGPPGCGKTLVAKAVAGEANVPFFSISGAEFVESLVGVGAARVRDLFRQVRDVAPAIVFIDEIDAAGRKRGGLSGGQEERDQTLNQLLVEMDGFETTSGIVVIGATNRPDILDPALLRPGRFDRQITVTPPDVRGRQEILELHARNRPVSPQVDWEQLARRTPGFTGADLANVINEAALLGVRAGSEEIGMEQLEEAVLRVLVGPQRRGTLLTGEERRRIAFHESGHALVAAAVGHLDDVQRLSIVARGKALGQSMSSKRWQERAVLTRSELRTELLISMAGAAAEDLILGEPSTGADDDVDRATELAELMVGRFGMSERLGKVRMVRSEGSEFLGSQTVPADLTAGPVLMELHQEVRRLIDDAELGAREVLTRHRKLLVALAEQLEEAETLESAEIAALLDAVRPEMNVILDDDSQPVSPNGHTAGTVARGAQEL